MSSEIVVQIPVARYDELVEREKILLSEDNHLEVRVHVSGNVMEKDLFTIYKGEEATIHILNELKKLGQDKFCLANTLDDRNKEIRQLMLEKQRLNRELENIKSTLWYKIGDFLTRAEDPVPAPWDTDN